MLYRTILTLTISLSLAALPLMMPASDNVTLTARDEAFLHQIVNECSAQIRTAEAALRRPLTTAEREYAKHLIDTHLSLERVLRTIARSKNIPTRDEVQGDEQGHSVTASAVAERDFNSFFLRGEIASVSAEIALCEVELRDGTDEDLKLFASTYLPSLRTILVIAKEFAVKY